MKAWILGYLAVALTLPCAAVNLPLFSLSFEGSPQTAAIFVAAIPGALLVIGWPGLRPRHVLILPLLLLVLAPVSSLLLINLIPMFWPGLLEGALPAFGWGDYWSAHPIPTAWRLAPFLQGIVSLIAAVGLWMGARNQGVLIRRTADDREEIEQLYELLPHCPLPKPISLYRLQCLLADSRSVTAEFRGQRLGVLPVFALAPEIVFTDPIAPSAAGRLNLVRGLLSRPELAHAAGVTAALWDATELDGPLRDAGFAPIPASDQDLDHVIAMRKFLERLGEVRLLDAEYFSGHRTFYRRAAREEGADPE